MFKMKSPIVLILLTITSISISISNKYAIAKSITQEEREIDMGNVLDEQYRGNNNNNNNAENKAGKKINVHIIPHSHMDVGWLKTVDQCYYGANGTIQKAGCQYILDSVVAALNIDPTRKFTYAEQAFFQRWYEEQSTSKKEVVKQLVKNKQLVFVDGGWAQHDEGCLHFTTMIDQTTFGTQFLKDEFDVIPTIGWHLDPFGHTSTQASLLTAEVGFDAFYFARIDYQDRIERRKNGKMEMLWRASPSLKNEIFSGAFVQGAYCSPPVFGWGGAFDGEPIMNNQMLEDENIQAKVDFFVSSVQEYATYSQGENVMYMMGCDYAYENAFEWYNNVDRLISAVNADGRVFAKYSDAVTYTQEKHQENLTWSIKTDDFIPCAQDWTEESGLRGHMYWSGYFTSRPTLKYYQRYSSNYLQTARQLQAWAYLKPDPKPSISWSPLNGQGLNPLSAAVALVSHHDAVTGTARQHVTNDYAKHLSLGNDLADVVVNEAFSKLTESSSTFLICKKLNVSICEPATNSLKKIGDTLYMIAYNPLGYKRSENIRVPTVVNHETNELVPKVTLLSKNNIVSSSLLPATGWASEKQEAASFSSESAPSVIVFNVALPPLGFETFAITLEKKMELESEKGEIIVKKHNSGDNTGVVSLENKYIKAEFNSVTGKLTSLTNKIDQITTNIYDQGFYYYTAKNSGPWMLRPDQTKAEDAIPVSDKAQLSVIKSSTNEIIEVVQIFDDWITQTIRLVDDILEMEWSVGPVPVTGINASKELFSRFKTDIDSKHTWTTDSNAYEMIDRVVNHRDTFKLNVTEPIASNVVNVNSVISIKDDKRQFMVLNDRSQGGTSLDSGLIDIFVHRRLLGFDYPGGGMGPNGEPLNETRIFGWHAPDTRYWYRDGPGIVVRGKHRVGITSIEHAAKMYRVQSEKMFRSILLGFDVNGGINNVNSFKRFSGSALKKSLPENVKLLTLQQYKNKTNTFLIRLMHKFAVNEDVELSKPVTVSLTDLFNLMVDNNEISSIEETTLLANEKLEYMEKRRLQFHGETPLNPNAKLPLPMYPKYNVLLTPLKVRTFIVSF